MYCCGNWTIFVIQQITPNFNNLFLGKIEDAWPGLYIVKTGNTLSGQNNFIKQAFDYQTVAFNG